VDTEEMMTQAGAIVVSPAGEGDEGGELETKSDDDAASMEMTKQAVTLAAHKSGQVEAALRNLDRKRVASSNDPWISTMHPPVRVFGQIEVIISCRLPAHSNMCCRFVAGLHGRGEDVDQPRGHRSRPVRLHHLPRQGAAPGGEAA